jgi:hypothetical protein
MFRSESVAEMSRFGSGRTAAVVPLHYTLVERRSAVVVRPGARSAPAPSGTLSHV